MPVASAIEVDQACILLTIASGENDQTSTLAVGCRSGDAVTNLAGHFNAEGTSP